MYFYFLVSHGADDTRPNICSHLDQIIWRRAMIFLKLGYYPRFDRGQPSSAAGFQRAKSSRSKFLRA
jgi:hypothetical protein